MWVFIPSCHRLLIDVGFHSLLHCPHTNGVLLYFFCLKFRSAKDKNMHYMKGYVSFLIRPHLSKGTSGCNY
jgi:hypothetical protein